LILLASRFWPCISRTAAALLVATAGCREYPPQIPPDFIGSPAAAGWPPLAVYVIDAFDPKNRWFHRAFGSRSLSADIIAPHADEPCPLSVPSRVDAAELIALLERIPASPSSGGATAVRDLVAEAVFRSDALAEASRLQAKLPPDALAVKEAVPLLLQLATGDPPPPLDGPAARALEPPPLRGGEWVETAPLEAPGLLPSASDPRWTRSFIPRDRPDGGSRHRALVVRFRVTLDRRGSPLLLPIASECWELERGEDGATGNVWRFDRAEWLAGRDPWRRLPEETEITIHDPADPSKLVTGQVSSLAARIGAQGLGVNSPGAPGDVSRLEAVARVLQGVLAPRGDGP
jgi:hypothetical protein